MKNLSLTIAAVAVAGVAVQATAQVFTYADNDVIIAIRQDSSALTDVLIDLGPVSNFTSLSLGTHVIRNTGTISGQADGYNIANGIRAAYGNTLPAGLDVTAIGSDFSGDNTLFLSRTRNGATAVDTTLSGIAGSTPWKRANKTVQANPAGVINTVGSLAFATSGTGVVSGNGFVALPADAVQSYTVNAGTAGNLNNTFGQGNIESQTKAGSVLYFDFYQMNFQNTNPKGNGTYLGFFTLDTHANLYFTPAGSAVPEPRTYAIAGGLGLLAFAAWRRRSSK
jgi:hypothetical protein